MQMWGIKTIERMYSFELPLYTQSWSDSCENVENTVADIFCVIETSVVAKQDFRLPYNVWKIDLRHLQLWNFLPLDSRRLPSLLCVPGGVSSTTGERFCAESPSTPA